MRYGLFDFSWRLSDGFPVVLIYPDSTLQICSSPQLDPESSHFFSELSLCSFISSSSSCNDYFFFVFASLFRSDHPSKKRYSSLEILSPSNCLYSYTALIFLMLSSKSLKVKNSQIFEIAYFLDKAIFELSIYEFLSTPIIVAWSM
jgi:hypothetical protein